VISKLIQENQKPSIFQKGSSEFWTDDYISQQLLESHLDPKSDAASRRLEVIDATVNWIDNFICQQIHSKEILDLGCGPGLYTQRLAKQGYSVTGIDFSKRSVDYAKQQASDENIEITYICENYVSCTFPKQYDTIVMIYCDFGVLDELSRDVLLKKIYEALRPGGVFVFDVFRPRKYKDHKETKTWDICNRGFWRPGPHLCLNSSYWYEDSGVHLDQHIIVDEDRQLEIYNIWDRTYSIDEIYSLLSSTGFVGMEVYDDFSGKPYTEECDTICVLARKE